MLIKEAFFPGSLFEKRAGFLSGMAGKLKELGAEAAKKGVEALKDSARAAAADAKGAAGKSGKIVRKNVSKGVESMKAHAGETVEEISNLDKDIVARAAEEYVGLEGPMKEKLTKILKDSVGYGKDRLVNAAGDLKGDALDTIFEVLDNSRKSLNNTARQSLRKKQKGLKKEAGLMDALLGYVGRRIGSKMEESVGSKIMKKLEEAAVNNVPSPEELAALKKLETNLKRAITRAETKAGNADALLRRGASYDMYPPSSRWGGAGLPEAFGSRDARLLEEYNPDWM